MQLIMNIFFREFVKEQDAAGTRLVGLNLPGFGVSKKGK